MAIDDWQSKVLIGLIPVVITITGWGVSLENRVQVIDARQQERTGRIKHIEEMMDTLNKAVVDPSPKPETKVAVEGLRRDVDNCREDLTKVTERLNNLHSFLLQTPTLRPRRGDLFDQKDFGSPLLYPQGRGP